MATLFDLAQAYLNRALPETFRYDRTNQPAIPTPVPTPVVPEPIKQLPRPGGNEEGFSVYNPDPNRTRTPDRYSPYNYRQAAERNLIGDFYSSGTEAQKLMDSYPDYYTGPQLTGIPGAIQGYMKNSLAGQLLGKAASGIESLLPVNQRAILENEALGAGIALDDIGRIVQGPGDYDSAENVMAGYNLAQITPETIQKRRETIKKTMSKPGYDGNLQERLDALDEFEEKMFGETGIKTKADIVFDDKSLAKDPTYKSTVEKITEGITTAEDDSGSDMLEGIETILGTKPITEYRDPIMDMVSPPTSSFPDYSGVTGVTKPGAPTGIETIKNIIDTPKSLDKDFSTIGDDLMASLGLDKKVNIMDDLDNLYVDSGKIKTDATTKTKTKTKSKGPTTGTTKPGTGGRGPVTGTTKPGTKSKGPTTGTTKPGTKSKSIPDRGRGQSNVGTKSKGPVSTKGQAGPPSQRGGGGGGGGGGGCFLKGTLITMLDGTRKPVEQVDLGNEVAIGGKVFATGKFLVKNLHDYKGIKVSGSHMVSENNKWVRVEDSEHGKLLGNEEHTVYVFGSENRRILINDILFTDYFEVNEQDKLMNNEEDFFDNWKLYAKQDSGNNVDIINAS
jgi:hypothetical protein